MAKEPTYDAFVSYSHHADGKLAPAIQNGLQRLAKPWNRRRALEVFRDDTSLSVNPHLWTSITEALDSSAWFVLMASPAAASSEWVNMEVEHWLAGGDGRADRILPVLTGGVWEWEGTGFSDATTAVPPALHGVFTEEPRHLDLSWANESVDLDLDNARFRQAIAQIAAPMHGTTQDDLIGDDVRLHRRAVLIRRTATAALAVLFAGAVIAAAFAFRQQSIAEDNAEEATRQQGIAEDNAEEATRQQGIAEDNAEEATRQQGIAEDNAAESRSRELAARAEQLVDVDPALAVLLSVQAHHPVDATLDHATPEADRSLRLANASLATTEAVRRPLRIETDATTIGASADGTMIATTGTPTGSSLEIIVWDAETGNRIGEPYENPLGTTSDLRFDRSGRFLLASGSGWPVLVDLERERSTELAGGVGRADFLGADEVVAVGPFGGFGAPTVIRIYALEAPDDPPMEFPMFPSDTFQPSGPFDEVRSLPSGTIVLSDASGSAYSWMPGEGEPTLIDGVIAESMSWEALPTVDSVVVSGPTLEPDVNPQFQLIEYDLGDLASPTERSYVALDELAWNTLSVAPNGERFAAFNGAGLTDLSPGVIGRPLTNPPVYVYDRQAPDFTPPFELPINGGHDIAWLGNDAIATMSARGVEVYDLPRRSRGEVYALGVSGDGEVVASWDAVELVIRDRNLAVVDRIPADNEIPLGRDGFDGFADEFLLDPLGRFAVTVHENDGPSVRPLSGDAPWPLISSPKALTPDGDLAVMLPSADVGSAADFGLSLVDTTTWAVVDAIPVESAGSLPIGHLAATSGAETIALNLPGMLDNSSTLRVIDRTSGARRDAPSTPGISAMTFDPAGSTLATGHVDGTVRLWDPVGPELRHVIDVSTRAVDDLSFSGDGSNLAVGAGPLTLWDVSTRDRLFDSSAIAHLEGARFQFVRYDPTRHRVITSVDGGVVAIDGSDLVVACASVGEDDLVRAAALRRRTVCVSPAPGRRVSASRARRHRPARGSAGAAG